MFKIFLFIFVTASLYSQTILKDIYFIQNNSVYLSDIVPDTNKKKILFTINSYKHSKRIKSKDLLNILKDNGVEDIESSSRYITFQISSPIDTQPLKDFISNYFKEKYPNILIKSVEVYSRGYIDALPERYNIEIRHNSYLKHKGIINIKNNTGKKLYFNYNIDASMKVLVAKQRIKRRSKLSPLNTKYTIIQFDYFKAFPILKLKKNSYQAARHIKIDEIITLKDVQKLNLVRKNTIVSASLYNEGIYITFEAKALQSGALGDIITIQKRDLKRLKATVIGTKRVQIQ